jgi:hypothetical protein
MALTKKERGNTFVYTSTFTSGSTKVNASGNIVNFTLYKPDGTIKMGPISGNHRSIGIYDCYMSTSSTDDLGIYIAEAKGYFQYQTQYPWGPKYDREEIQIVHIE